MKTVCISYETSRMIGNAADKNKYFETVKNSITTDLKDEVANNLLTGKDSVSVGNWLDNLARLQGYDDAKLCSVRIVGTLTLPLELVSLNIDGLLVEHRWSSAKEFLEDWNSEDPSIGDNEILLVRLANAVLYCSLGNKSKTYDDTVRTCEVADWFGSQEQDDGCKKDTMPKTKLCLADLIHIGLEDIHLVHNKIDNEPTTIVELSDDTLTGEGREAWKDVLDGGKVERIFEGIYGLQIEISGVKASRLDSFSRMLAGYCSQEDYQNWVRSEHEEVLRQAQPTEN